jgi:hypothetical protein
MQYRVRTLLILLAVLPPVIWMSRLALDWCGFWSPRLKEIEIRTVPPRSGMIDDGSWNPSYPHTADGGPDAQRGSMTDFIVRYCCEMS